MTKTLNISATRQLPIDIGTETLAILGRRGSGKSNTGTVLIEELLDVGQQVVLLDPKGEGWGLKAQGGGPGKDVVVFGEPEGDLPLREEHGEMIAEWVVSSGRSVVLSLAGFDSDAASRRFVARFAERLFTLKRRPQNHGPLMVVIEEAHLFVPQRVEGAQADVVSRIQRLVRQGRSMGLGVTLIDQRAASVNKDVLTQIELLICHQLTSPHDRKAIDAWIEANAEPEQAAEFRRSLPTLQSGQAWIWSPAKLKLFERVNVRRRTTFDSGATPILGKSAAQRPAMREVDLDALRGQLDQVVEEKKANDPAELKKQIAGLQRDLAAKPAASAKPVEKLVITDTQVAGMERLAAKMESAVNAQGVKVEWFDKAIERFQAERRSAENFQDELWSHLDQLRIAIETAKSSQPRTIASGVDAIQSSLSRRQPEPARAAKAVKPAAHANGETATLPAWFRPAHQKLLNALAWLAAMGQPTWDRSIVAAIAGVSPKSSSFANDVSRLSAGHYLSYPSPGEVQLTPYGVAFAARPKTPPTLNSLHEAWRKCPALRPAHLKLLDALIAQHPDDLSRDELAEAAGVSPASSSFANDVSRLSALKLARYPVKGRVGAGPLLFPEGLS